MEYIVSVVSMRHGCWSKTFREESLARDYRALMLVKYLDAEVEILTRIKAA